VAAYDFMVSDHWVMNLVNLPDAARGYFACFALIRNAWDSCVNGAWLLRLAFELAPDEAAREDVRLAAMDVEREMGAQLDSHFAERQLQLKSDPIRAAYETAKSEIRIAVGPEDEQVVEAVLSDAEQVVYDRSLKTLRRFIADLVRGRLQHPTTLRPDPAFEDTKAIPPSMMPEIARMRAEAEPHTQSPPMTQAPPTTQPQPQALGQTPPAPRVVPRPGSPGPGGVRSR
jgi:hypothetical protein